MNASPDTGEGGVRSLDVHCPRYGRVLLLDVPDRGRFIAAGLNDAQHVVGLLPAQGDS